jgi:hypothetical protein
MWFQGFVQVSSRSQRVLLGLSCVSVVIGVIAVVVGILFENPPNKADPKWEDIYPFFSVFSYVAISGGALMICANTMSIVALLGWYHVLFIVQIILSCFNVILDSIGSIISFVGALVIVIACGSVESTCAPCTSSDLNKCEEIAESYGKGCFYNANDFSVICGDMRRKLFLVGLCLATGLMFSLFSCAMGCLTCRRMKHNYSPVIPELDQSM